MRPLLHWDLKRTHPQRLRVDTASALKELSHDCRIPLPDYPSKKKRIANLKKVALDKEGARFFSSMIKE